MMLSIFHVLIHHLCICPGDQSFHVLFFKFLFYSQLTYSITLFSGVQHSDSTVPYNTQYSSQQVHSFIPITYFNHPPPTFLLVTISLFSIVESVSYFLSLFFPLRSFVLFLKFHIWMKPYGIFLWLISLSIILPSFIHVVTDGKRVLCLVK